jgi:hypothetical protein
MEHFNADKTTTSLGALSSKGPQIGETLFAEVQKRMPRFHPRPVSARFDVDKVAIQPISL